jgi:hypothetical protein
MKSLAALTILALAGCAKSAPAPGKTVTIENACNEPDGTQVRVTGQLGSRRGLLSFCSNYGGKKTCDLALTAGGEGEPAELKLSVPVGEAPGEMAELPEKFSAQDIVVHLPAGAKASTGAKLTVDGKLSVAPAANASQPKVCWVNVEWATL